MRLNAFLALTAAMALGGCETSALLPAQTGSLGPAVSTSVFVERANQLEAALPNAIRTCLNRGAQVMSPEFQQCVTAAQRKAVPPADGQRDRKSAEAASRQVTSRQ